MIIIIIVCPKCAKLTITVIPVIKLSTPTEAWCNNIRFLTTGEVSNIITNQQTYRTDEMFWTVYLIFRHDTIQVAISTHSNVLYRFQARCYNIMYTNMHSNLFVFCEFWITLMIINNFTGFNVFYICTVYCPLRNNLNIVFLFFFFVKIKKPTKS